MKTFAKVMVVFACIFLVGGIALFAVGYVGGGGKEVLNALIISDDDFTYMEQTAEGDFATLSVVAPIMANSKSWMAVAPLKAKWVI